MSNPSREEVTEIVARFFEQRNRGRRVSIDDVLETMDISDRTATRTHVQEAIARESRIRLTSAATIDSASSGSAIADPTSWDELPEIEGYDIIDVLGKGGMGMVYEAYQQSTGRRVAVKFMLGQAAASESGRRRFEREVELVARLEHPNIVSILDSGVHRRRWYYVMEYVDGRSLDDAISPGECNIRDVLDLVARVSDAVDYAHQRGVLHRDLKPSNIILDSRGEPRLLDFGLAKAIDPVSKAGAEMTLSEPGQIIGTLAFMPPEQSRGRYDQLSVRTDVYSLGAVGYDLITGKLPCSMEGSLSAVLKRIEEVDPTPPSSIRPKVSKDVDAILLKALEKAPANRYSTAGEFATDIRRYLNDEPVIARRTSSVVRATRWMRRNRLATTVGAVSLGVILIIAAYSTYAIVSNIRARLDRTDLQEQTSAWLSESMKQFTPDQENFQLQFTLMDQNDLYARRLIDDPPRRREVTAAVHLQVGDTYVQLRAFDKAEYHYREALSILRDISDEDNAELAEAMHGLAASLWWQGNYAAAEPLYRQALDMRIVLFGPNSLQAADTTNHLAACLDRMQQDEEAERMYREALRIRRVALAGQPEEQEPIAASLNNLAKFLQESDEPDRAEPIFRESLELIKSIRGDDDRRVGSVLTNLADCLIDQGRYDEAEPMLIEALNIYERRLGDDNTSVAKVHYERANIFLARDSLEDARSAASLSLDIRQRKLPEDHDDIADSHMLLGVIAMRNASFDVATTHFRQCLDIRVLNPARNDRHMAEAKAALGASLLPTNRTEADTHIAESFDLYEQLFETPTLRVLRGARLIETVIADSGDEIALDEFRSRREEAEAQFNRDRESG